MAITARSENRSSDIVDLEQVLIHLISEKFSENDHSASVLVISRVQAMTRRRWMFGKASSSQAPSASKRLLEAPYLSTARVLSIYLPHFQGIWEMECLSPNAATVFLC